MINILTLARIVWLEMMRRKDVYVLLILLVVFLGVLMSLDIFGLGKLVSYVKETGLLLAWGLSWIMAVSISARQLPQEETRGTIFTLLAKPVSRAHVLLGKWLGSWFAAAAATLAFYLILAGIVALRGGIFNAMIFAQALGLHCALLGIITAIGIAFSTRLHADAAAVMTYVVTLAAWVILPRVPDLVLGARGAAQTGLMIIYYALPHLEVFDMRQRLIYDWPPAAGAAVLLALAYGLCVTALVLLLGWLAYRNRRFTRGTIL